MAQSPDARIAEPRRHRRNYGIRAAHSLGIALPPWTGGHEGEVGPDVLGTVQLDPRIHRGAQPRVPQHQPTTVAWSLQITVLAGRAARALSRPFGPMAGDAATAGAAMTARTRLRTPATVSGPRSRAAIGSANCRVNLWIAWAAKGARMTAPSPTVRAHISVRPKANTVTRSHGPLTTPTAQQTEGNRQHKTEGGEQAGIPQCPAAATR